MEILVFMPKNSHLNFAPELCVIDKEETWLQPRDGTALRDNVGVDINSTYLAMINRPPIEPCRVIIVYYSASTEPDKVVYTHHSAIHYTMPFRVLFT